MGTTITILFEARRPSAVPRGIGAIVVLAFESEPWRPWSHVGQERREARPPACAHRDATRAVVLKMPVVSIEAAILRALPRDVGTGAGLAVRAKMLAAVLVAKTPAASDASSDQVCGPDDQRTATLTSAIPGSAGSSMRGLTMNDQPTESTVLQVLERRHAGLDHSKKGGRNGHLPDAFSLHS